MTDFVPFYARLSLSTLDPKFIIIFFFCEFLILLNEIEISLATIFLSNYIQVKNI